MRKLLILKAFSIFILFNSCSNKNANLSTEDINLLKSCVEYIENDQSESDFLNCYLVDPYFVPFLISNHFESLDESFVQLFKQKSIGYYKNPQETLNQQLTRKYNLELEKLSTCNNKSYYILSFSEIGDDILMAYIYVYDKNLSNQNLKEGKYDSSPQEIIDYVFLLDENKNIKKVLTGGVIFN